MRATPNPRTHWDWIRTFNSEVERIVTLVHDRSISVVVTSSLPNLHGGIVARRAGVACVWKIVDSFPPAVARHAYMPLVLSLADVVMTTGRQVAAQHPGATSLGDRWISYYPSVDTSKFRADGAIRSSVRAELGISADDVVIGNVANLNPMKGHIHFIRAAGSIVSTHPGIKFVILGQQYPHFAQYCDGLWLEARNLGLELGKNLIVRDPGRRVSDLAQAFDIFWMTSEPRSEGIPTVIGEAKSLGLPVVATDVGSIAEAVTSDVSGYVVQPRSPDQIARATRLLLDSSEKRMRMSRAARNEAEMQFSFEKASSLHVNAYTRAVEVHRAGRSGRKPRRARFR
jgi:glycosyltransferase involved in cell wall biosynthesis